MNKILNRVGNKYPCHLISDLGQIIVSNAAGDDGY